MIFQGRHTKLQIKSPNYNILEAVPTNGPSIIIDPRLNEPATQQKSGQVGLSKAVSTLSIKTKSKRKTTWIV